MSKRNTEYKQSYDYAANNADICHYTDAPVRWRLADRYHRPQARVIIGLLLVFILLFLFSKPNTTSPFVGALLDLLEPDSNWLIPQLGGLGATFWLGLLFILVLTFLLAQLRFSLLHSGIERKQELDPEDGTETSAFYRRMYLQRVGFKQGGWVFWLMAISNVLLFFYYRQRILSPEIDLVGNKLFSLVFALAILSRVLALFWGLGTLIQYFLNDYGRRIREFTGMYWRYFYPPVLSILIIVYIVSSMDQFDSLFIELVLHPWNLLIFTMLLLPASIVVVWFAPNYLFFTDYNYSNRLKIWFNLKAKYDAAEQKPSKFMRFLYGTIYKHKRLSPNNSGPIEEGLVPINFSRFRNKELEPASEAFHRTRMFLGMLYLVSLTSICLKIFFGNSNYYGGFQSILLLLIVGGAIVYWAATQNVLKKSVKKENERWRVLSPDRPLGSRWNRLYDHDHKRRPERVYYVNNRWFFNLGLIAAALSILLLLVTFALGFVVDSVKWYLPFFTFTLALGMATVGFVWLAVFRRFYQQYTFDGDLPKTKEEAELLYRTEDYEAAGVSKDTTIGASPLDRRMDRLDSWLVQLMLDFLIIIAVAWGLFFIIGLCRGDSFLHSNLLESLSPLNIFLLILNGIIAIILVLDRFLLTHEHGRQFLFLSRQDSRHATYDRTGTANLFWGTMIVLFLLMSWYFGNSYHQIDYRTDNEETELQGLDYYSQRFWERYQAADPTKPILMIASDGGGLKACYWTLRNLLELDRMGLVDNNLFMTSGASGGNMGLSMYTYLKADPNVSLDEIEERIEALGSRNYLSGDLTGFMTRFPLRYLPNHFGPNKLQDRTEAMARAYFHIASGADVKYDYDEVRQRPYSAVWRDLDYNLPLFVANTSRAEDGMRGVVHPFRPEPDMTAGMIDLTAGPKGWISYPDAAFLSNRFPLVSPAARIKGKGHFLDAGQSDNSGLATIYQFLNYIKAQCQREDLPATSIFRDSSFQADFFQRVVVISLRNAPSRFTRDAFLDQKENFNRLFPQSEVSANTSTAVNTGLTGVPRAWDDYLRSNIPRQLGVIDTFMALNLPFRIDDATVQSVIGGEMINPDLRRHVDSLNCRFLAAAGCLEVEQCTSCEGRDKTAYPKLDSPCFTVEPPLGRMIAEPALRLMDKMIDYPDNRQIINWLDTKRYD